ncbi:MAG: hypothetical protein AAF950_17795 [Pseudomonadota bacterium]
MRLNSALNRYLVTITPEKKGASVESYRIGKWLRHPLASELMADIRRRDIVSARDDMLMQGLAPTSVKNQLYLLSNVYRVAADEWDVDVVNPVAGIRMPKNRPHRTRSISLEEERRLLAACSPRIRSMVI